MEKMNKILGVKILNIWIIRKGGLPIFIKNYESTFEYGDNFSDPLITAMLDGFLNIFNKGIVGDKCEEMRFGNKVFTFHYPDEPINFTTVMICEIKTNFSVTPYLIILTETISKIFADCYKEVLLGLGSELEKFQPFERKIDSVVDDFIKKLTNNEEEFIKLKKTIFNGNKFK